MALNTLKCNHLLPLHFKGLKKLSNRNWQLQTVDEEDQRRVRARQQCSDDCWRHGGLQPATSGSTLTEEWKHYRVGKVRHFGGFLESWGGTLWQLTREGSLVAGKSVMVLQVRFSVNSIRTSMTVEIYEGDSLLTADAALASCLTLSMVCNTTYVCHCIITAPISKLPTEMSHFRPRCSDHIVAQPELIRNEEDGENARCRQVHVQAAAADA